jgi:hypothetical protein
VDIGENQGSHAVCLCLRHKEIDYLDSARGGSLGAGKDKSDARRGFLRDETDKARAGVKRLRLYKRDTLTRHFSATLIDRPTNGPGL